MSTAPMRVPRAWRALVAHSYRLSARWAFNGLRRRNWPERRAGLYHLLVPLEPWRYYELARVAGEPFAGECLDVSSPKLLASYLNARGAGRWTAVDLFADELERWRTLDPNLDLREADARNLPFPDDSFDAIACISVIEHIPENGDTRAMHEMWRVLKPGGVLHLTTNVAATATDVWTEKRFWGHASEEIDGRIFFERRYSDAELTRRLLALPWDEEHREYARERRPLSARFFAARPRSFLLGPLLPLVCTRNFAAVDAAAEVPAARHAAIYLRLRKPRA